MLNSLRGAARTWVAKLLLLLLVLSFAIWGVSDQITRGFGGDNVLEAGESAVTVNEYRLQLERAIAEESQVQGRRLSRAEAFAAGAEATVRARAVGSVVLDEQARRMALGLTEDGLAKAISEDFGGQLSGTRIRQVLREAGLTEAQYVADREKEAKRQQIIEASARGMAVPDTFLGALHRYQNQTRDIVFVEIDAAGLDPVAEPTAAELETFFAENIERYRAPEYRTITHVLLTPEVIADPDAIADGEVRAEYDANRARYGEPETRTIQQLVFADNGAATVARERILAGARFEDEVTALGRTLEDVTLGTFRKTDVPDQAIGEAAFALADTQSVSDILDSPFGPRLIRVSEITPERVAPFEDVAATIREELALAQANDVLSDIHDAYEDARAGGATMQEAAERQQLVMATLPPIDRAGAGKDGVAVMDIPERDGLLDAAFAAAEGEENRPLNVGRFGYLFYEVAGIEAPRDRTLDEVRATVIADWKADRLRRALDADAERIAALIRDGADPEAIATENGYRIDRKFGLQRAGNDADLGRAGIAGVFEAAPKAVAIAAGATGERRLVYRVEAINDPVGGAEAVPADLRRIVSANLIDDLLNQMVNRLQDEFPVTLNQSALTRALDTGTN